MLTVADTLSADHVLLDLAAASPAAAIDAVIRALRHDERVLDAAALNTALRVNPPCRVTASAAFGICLPHARTAAVSDMVMSAARLATEVRFEACDHPVRYLFCIAVPQAMAADYLRIAGALMRIFTDAETEHALHTASTSTAFVQALTRLECKL